MAFSPTIIFSTLVQVKHRTYFLPSILIGPAICCLFFVIFDGSPNPIRGRHSAESCHRGRRDFKIFVDFLAAHGDCADPA